MAPKVTVWTQKCSNGGNGVLEFLITSIEGGAMGSPLDLLFLMMYSHVIIVSWHQSEKESECLSHFVNYGKIMVLSIALATYITDRWWLSRYHCIYVASLNSSWWVLTSWSAPHDWGMLMNHMTNGPTSSVTVNMSLTTLSNLLGKSVQNCVSLCVLSTFLDGLWGIYSKARKDDMTPIPQFLSRFFQLKHGTIIYTFLCNLSVNHTWYLKHTAGAAGRKGFSAYINVVHGQRYTHN